MRMLVIVMYILLWTVPVVTMLPMELFPIHQPNRNLALVRFLKILLTPEVATVFCPVTFDVLDLSIIQDYCNPTKHMVFYFAVFPSPTRRESTTPNLTHYKTPLILDHNHSRLQ